MCVIFVSGHEKPRVSEDWIVDGDKANPHGIGIGWIEDGKVAWEKGLDTKTAFMFAQEVPQPYVMHFRLATAGDASEKLTHPFPVSDKVGLNLSGSAKSVIFHNGHWSGWEKTMEITRRVARKKDKRVQQEWSDSRLIAWLTYRMGEDFLKDKSNLQGGRVVLLDTSGATMYGDGWHLMDNIWVSSQWWRNKVQYKTQDYSHYGHYGSWRSTWESSRDSRSKAPSAGTLSHSTRSAQKGTISYYDRKNQCWTTETYDKDKDAWVISSVEKMDDNTPGVTDLNSPEFSDQGDKDLTAEIMLTPTEAATLLFDSGEESAMEKLRDQGDHEKWEALFAEEETQGMYLNGAERQDLIEVDAMALDHTRAAGRFAGDC